MRVHAYAHVQHVRVKVYAVARHISFLASENTRRVGSVMHISPMKTSQPIVDVCSTTSKKRIGENIQGVCGATHGVERRSPASCKASKRRSPSFCRTNIWKRTCSVPLTLELHPTCFCCLPAMTHRKHQRMKLTGSRSGHLQPSTPSACPLRSACARRVCGVFCHNLRSIA